MPQFLLSVWHDEPYEFDLSSGVPDRASAEAWTQRACAACEGPVELWQLQGSE